MSQSAKDRYMNDPEYHYLVDIMESMIAKNQFTPSEMRDAAVMASINYQRNRMRQAAKHLHILVNKRTNSKNDS